VFGSVRNSRVVRLAMAVSERYGRDSGGYLSAAIAYYAFLSLFPLLLLAFSVIGFLLAGSPGVQEDVADRIAEAVPGLETIVGRNIDALVAARTGAGLIGLAGVLWTGTGVVGAARNAVRRVFREPLPEGIVQDKVLLVALTVGLGVVALTATGLAGVTAGLDAEGPLGVLLLVGAPVLAFVLDLGLFVAAYRVLRRERRSWREVFPGALFAAIGWTLLKLIGTWYATRVVGNASAVYGTFATTVGVLVLLYLAARLFVYGAELDAVLLEETGKEEEGGGGSVEPHGNGEGAGRGPTDRSTPQLMRSIGADTVTLVRKEVELAKQEVKEGIAAKLMGVVGLAIAGVLALYFLGFGAAAGAAGLSLVLPSWAALLIVGGAFLLLAGIFAVVGLGALRRAPLAPRKTKETVKEDIEWARAQLRR
jgi:membrane protein